MQYNENPKNSHSIIVKPVNTNRINKDIKGKSRNKSLSWVNLTDSLDRTKEEYLDRYEGIKSEILNTTRFDKNSDLSTAYLGKVNMTWDDDLAIEEKFSITEQGYTVGKLLDSTECQILLDTGASKSFMSKSYYLHCKSLHSLQKFASKTKRIQAGNGQYVSILFVIPMIIEIAGHRFEIYMLVSKIHESVDIVIGIKNVFELEGVINLQEYCFSFQNWSIPIFPKEKIIIKPGENKIVRIEALFSDGISRSLAIIKLLDKITQSVIMLKVKFLRNTTMIDITNSNSIILILNPKEVIGILDLRSLGYYKIKQRVLQQNLSRYYKFELAEEVCTQFNNLINTLKKEQSLDLGEKYLWLDDSDERKYVR